MFQSKVGMTKIAELLCRSLARKLGYTVQGGPLKNQGSISHFMTAPGEAYDRNPELVVHLFNQMFQSTGVDYEVVEKITQTIQDEN